MYRTITCPNTYDMPSTADEYWDRRLYEEETHERSTAARKILSNGITKHSAELINQATTSTFPNPYEFVDQQLGKAAWPDAIRVRALWRCEEMSDTLADMVNTWAGLTFVQLETSPRHDIERDLRAQPLRQYLGRLSNEERGALQRHFDWNGYLSPVFDEWQDTHKYRKRLACHGKPRILLGEKSKDFSKELLSILKPISRFHDTALSILGTEDDEDFEQFYRDVGDAGRAILAFGPLPVEVAMLKHADRLAQRPKQGSDQRWRSIYDSAVQKTESNPESDHPLFDGLCSAIDNFTSGRNAINNLKKIQQYFELTRPFAQTDQGGGYTYLDRGTAYPMPDPLDETVKFTREEMITEDGKEGHADEWLEEAVPSFYPLKDSGGESASTPAARILWEEYANFWKGLDEEVPEGYSSHPETRVWANLKAGQPTSSPGVEGDDEFGVVEGKERPSLSSSGWGSFRSLFSYLYSP